MSIVVPVRNDATALAALFDDLDRIADCTAERIVVDGGSDDESFAIARMRATHALRSRPGRATQLAAGVRCATGRWIWMLHADSRVTPEAWHALRRALAEAPAWGRFDVRLDATGPAFRVIERSMNVRSRWTGICTGDQGIFVRRDVLAASGGVPLQALMEDIELSKRLRRHARPTCIGVPLVTSARRWQRNGVLPTILLMWRMRLRYFFGASPDDLQRAYDGSD